MPTDRTQEIKNLKAVATACKNYTDAQITKAKDDLRWELGTHDLSVDSDTDTAHIKTLPSGTIQTTVAKVEGVGYKVNQLVQNGNFANSAGWTSWAYGNSLEISNNECHCYGTTHLDISRGDINFINGHKYFFAYSIKGNEYSTNTYVRLGSNETTSTTAITTSYNIILSIVEATANSSRFYIFAQGSSASNEAYFKNVNIFDLTADFGAGNEPSTVSDCASAYLQRGVNIYEYTPQQSSIKNNEFTGVTVEGVNKCSYPTFAAYNYDWYTNRTLSSAVNPIKLLANKTYKVTGNNEAGDQTIKCRLFDMNGNLITSGAVFEGMGFGSYQNSYGGYNGSNYTTVTNFKITVPQDCYIDIVTAKTTYNPCVQLYIDGNETYVPYIQPTIISVDLTTIKDSNNVSLFPSGKLMGTNNADFITPYNQESRWNEEKMKDLNWIKFEYDTNVFIANVPLASNNNILVCNLYEKSTATTIGTTADKTIRISTDGTKNIVVRDAGYNDATTFKNHFTNDDVLQYERATYLTSNTDLTSLTRINAQSNGTITLNNTNNVDMPNTIKYLKEVAK